MRWIGTAIAVAAVIVVLALLVDTPPNVPNDPEEQKRLQGAWHVVGIVTGGKTTPAQEVKGFDLRYVFEGDRLIIRRPGQPDSINTFSIDITSVPKKLKLNHVPPYYAVYAIEGNRMQLCLMIEPSRTATYPTELASKESPMTDLLTLERR